jgi:hypothetical protein
MLCAFVVATLTMQEEVTSSSVAGKQHSQHDTEAHSNVIDLRAMHHSSVMCIVQLSQAGSMNQF